MTARSDLAVHAEGLVKTFGGTRALDGVDLEIPTGQVLGLLGPNGAGKTTTVRVLTTLLRPDSGRAWVGGHDVLADPESVRRGIGLSGQYAAVDENLTGYENLYMVGRFYGMSHRQAGLRARELLTAFGLTESGDRPSKTYSGGMRRRLDLAGALVARPAVVVAVVDRLRRRRAVVLDAAVGHDDRPVEVLLERTELVRHEDHGRAGVGEPPEDACHRLLVGEVDAGVGLVEEECLRLAGQGAGDERTLLLAAGQRGDAVVRAVREVGGLQRLLDRDAIDAPERAEQRAPRQAPGGDDLPHRRRHTGGGPAALRDEADPVPVVEPRDRRAEEPRLASGEWPEPEHRAREGGLAGAVGTEHDQPLAGLDGQVDASEDGAAGDGDVAGGDLDDGGQQSDPSRIVARFDRIKVR